MKDLSFVIINYNDSDTTMRLIDNIKDYKVLKEIVIVDNNSTDDSVKKLKKVTNNKITLLVNDENKGYSSGMNFGAKYLLEKYKDINIIFSNADIIIKSEQDLITLNSRINDDVVLVGPTVNEHGNINRGWRLSTPFKESLYNIPYFHKKLKKRFLYYGDEYYKEDISYVDVVSGCFFLINGDFLKKINYFDDNVFLYYEENILASKIKKENKKVIIDNTIEIIHDHSVTIDKSIKRVNKYKVLKKSQRYYVINYLKANTFMKILLCITRNIGLLGIKLSNIFRGGKK